MAEHKPRLYKTAARDKIRKALDADGPSCAADIAERAGVSSSSITQSLRKWRNADPDALHIGAWKRQEGKGGRWGAVWALGPGKDAPEPVRDDILRHRQWRLANKLRLRVKGAARRGRPMPAWLVGLIP